MRPLIAACTLLALALAAPPATALTVSSGTTTLPLSGFVVDLPARPGHSYELEATYRLAPEPRSYGASDTLIVRDAARKRVETFHVRHGKLEAGCVPYLEGEYGAGDLETVSLHGHSGSLKVKAELNLVAFCATLKSESVIVIFTPAASATPAALEAGLATSQVAGAILASAATHRLETLAPLLRPDVRAAPGSRTYPAPVRLPKLAVDVVPTSDGFVWIHDPDASKDKIGDHLASIFPSASDVGVTVAHFAAGDCEAVWKRQGGKTRGRVTVAGFSGALFDSDTGLSYEAHLCRSLPDRRIVAQVRASAPLGDLQRFAPILGAIDKALRSLPAPPTTTPRPSSAGPSGPASPSRPSTPAASYRPSTSTTDGWLFGQFGSELIYSHRDTAGLDPDRHPAGRFIGPGLTMDFVYKLDGLLGRTSFAATFDWGQLFGGDASGAARWGASHLEANFELGYIFGDDFALGFMAGWTGVSGPLTLNSSLSLSMVLGMPPDGFDGFGWLLRVTPIQAFAANEREVFSPLDVALHLTPMPGLGLTLGFQYIGAPEPGDEDIPREGWAVSVKIGSGLFTRSP